MLTPLKSPMTLMMRITAPKKKHRFFFHKEEEVWEDDPTEDEESTSNFDDQILESAENRKAKMGSDDDFMDLNNL